MERERERGREKRRSGECVGRETWGGGGGVHRKGEEGKWGGGEGVVRWEGKGGEGEVGKRSRDREEDGGSEMRLSGGGWRVSGGEMWRRKCMPTICILHDPYDSTGMRYIYIHTCKHNVNICNNRSHGHHCWNRRLELCNILWPFILHTVHVSYKL